MRARRVANVTSAPARPRRAGALSRPLTPSAELAAIVGDEPLTRTEIVKQVWTYIKAHRLQDPADGRVILPDAKLRAVFDRDRVDMLTMMGLLSPHLRAI